MRARFSLDEDPLSRVMAPPQNESPQQREERLHAEREAKRISDEIDEELNRQRIAEKKGPKPVKVLLLGQSESGKSTTLKNFQLMHSAKAFRAERASWRAVIQLNVVRSIRLILEAMSEAQAAAHPPSPSHSPYPYPISGPSRPPSPSTPAAPAKDYPPLTADHLKLKMRLSPLAEVEKALMRKLIPPGSPEFEATHLTQVTNLPHTRVPRREPSVNSSTAWKSAFTRLVAAGGRSSFESERGIDWDSPEDPGVVLHACGEDMIKLWHDPTIKQLLRVQKLRLDEMPGFFLDSLDRVTQMRYVPSDEDILRARIKTLGVSEYRFTLKAGNSISHDWRFYDVGGQRSLRAAWVPFFDDIDAIIFLAPISCFDQVLAEDASVNRLEDSVLLWKAIVSNPLLRTTNLVLFLNKCDILRAKLDTGIRLADYIVSYGDRPNDFESVSYYLRKKFAAIMKEFSPEPRSFYYHFTSVTDMGSTKLILENVRDVVLRQNLRRSDLI